MKVIAHWCPIIPGTSLDLVSYFCVLDMQINRVFPLLKSPLVSSEAYLTVEKLAGCVAAPRHMGADIAASLRMVATESILSELQATETPVKQKLPVVDRVVASLVTACENGPLPPPSFTVVYPVSFSHNYTCLYMYHIVWLY